MNTWENRMAPRVPAPLPRLELLETCWLARGPNTGNVLACAVYRTDAPGLEVRVGYSQDLLRSQRVRAIGVARYLAEKWRRAVIDKGFEQLPLELPQP